jgi:hypothetical protein
VGTSIVDRENAAANIEQRHYVTRGSYRIAFPFGDIREHSCADETACVIMAPAHGHASSARTDRMVKVPAFATLPVARD